MPTRVIDVGAPNGSEEPRLYITGGSRGSYVALSYCWGNSQSLTTTKESIHSRIQQIPMTTLPKTLQDAVTVTRKLRIRYLWIDALCIIQDSREDWEAESEKMAIVYEYAYITIAAAFANSTQEGMLQRKNILRVSLSPNGTCADDAGNLQLNDAEYHVEFRSSNLLKAFITEPLTGRAWVKQEQLLSRRILYFTRDRLIWICREESLDEHGRTRLPRDLWWSNILDYSGRLLSYKADKLSALAGITQAFQKNTGNYPLAGLWLEDLFHDLFWVPTIPTSRPPLEGFPSWSWASMDGEVMATEFKDGDPTFDPRVDVLDIKLSWSGKPLVSAITEGSIEVRGRLIWTECVLSSCNFGSRREWDIQLAPKWHSGGPSEDSIGYCFLDRVGPEGVSRRYAWCLMVMGFGLCQVLVLESVDGSATR
ncbi:heterokaryon incompatibility protein-domain-containing protein [Stachybotrys elegans]|uniref:Heterokaryon incompatibility protein-domain-containing protein n=1 Tax=Stachybotrys elegans TaxID=80388 RepID=A0A8K0SG39_9HYPO|nr:heterokaryon incompatibility protein-domain-containing protein [Stachybotrys elegans]